MSSKFPMNALAAVAMTVCIPAFAQSQPSGNMPNGSTGDASTLMQSSSNTQASVQMLASDIIGMPVKNGTGDKAQEIGKISDLVLDKDKQAVNAVIGVGGFLGIGSKDVGVPLHEVQFSPGADFAVLGMTKEQLEKAPAYTTTAMKKAREQQTTQRRQMTQPPQQPVPPAPTQQSKNR